MSTNLFMIVTLPLLLFGSWYYLFKKKVLFPITWKKLVIIIIAFLILGYTLLRQFTNCGGEFSLYEQDLSHLTKMEGILRTRPASHGMKDFYLETTDGKLHRVYFDLMNRRGGFVEYGDKPLTLWLKGRYAYQASVGEEIIRPLGESNQNVSMHNWIPNLFLIWSFFLALFCVCMCISKSGKDGRFEWRDCESCGTLLGEIDGTTRQWSEYKFCPKCGQDSAPWMEIRHNEKLNPRERMGGLLALAPILIGGGCLVFFVERFFGFILFGVFAVFVVVIAWDAKHPMECPSCFEHYHSGDCFCHNCGTKLKK